MGKKGGRGGHGASRKIRGGAPSGGGGDKKWEDRSGPSFIVTKNNEKFDAYYKEQRIVPEEEWESMLNAFKEPLPTTFRLTGSRATAQDLNEIIKSTYIPHLPNVWEGNPVPPPIQLPWYPDGLGWQLNVAKTIVRKSAEFKKFQDFLVYETDVGNVSRQEAVSMIPPLVLDVQPHHAVLDMCAAPGSKTAQLLEALHATPPTSSSSVSSAIEPTGVVIANDSDFRRAYMLVHQSARLHSTALMVTNLDASMFPTIRLPPPTTSENLKRKERKHASTLLFDRILCDIPCSGDGTLRKNPQIWNSWTPQNGNGLHPLQVRILVRAMGMLSPGGRIVYSTCSLNPVENEAVLAAALNATRGQFNLVDVSDHLPGLKRRPGLSHWRVQVAIDNKAKGEKEMRFFDSVEDWQGFLDKSGLNIREKREKSSKVANSLFPPSNATEMNLERSMRIYPHLQDTGGFFVAVLERVNDSSTTPAPGVEPTTQSSLKRTASDLSTHIGIPEIKKHKPIVASVADLASGSTSRLSPNANTEAGDSVLEEQEIQQALTIATPPEVDEASLAAISATAGTEEAKTAVPPGNWKESPYTFLPKDNHHLKALLSSLHINPATFPSERTFIRTNDLSNPRSVYVCNTLVRDIISANDPARIRLINCGVKAFTRQSNHEKEPSGTQGKDVFDDHDDIAPVAEEVPRTKDLVFRFVHEGVEAVLPHVEPSSILVANLDDLRRMLVEYYPRTDSFNGSFGEQLKSADQGAHLVQIKAGHVEHANLTRDLTVPLWVSPVSISLMSDKQQKSALCLRVFGEDFTLFGKSLKAKKQAKTATSSVVMDQPSEGVASTERNNDNNQSEAVVRAELEPPAAKEADIDMEEK